MAVARTFVVIMAIGLIVAAAADYYGSGNAGVTEDTTAATTNAPDKGGDAETGQRTCGLTGVGVIGDLFKTSVNGSSSMKNHGSHLVFPTIVGGQLALRNQLCWQISLRILFPNGIGNCGGTILGPSTILTAAHCFDGAITGANQLASEFAKNVRVRTGSLKSDAIPTDDETGCATQYTVKTITLHPQYDKSRNINDIAVLTLNKAMSFEDKPCQCTACIEDREPTVGDVCIVSGTGNEFTDDTNPSRPMKYVNVTILENVPALCNVVDAATDQQQTLCAGGVIGQNFCVGDSGGPLVCRSPLDSNLYSAGVVSESGNVCANEKNGKLTKTKFYLSWIRSVSVDDL
ncbi:putative Tryptase beta-2 [Hypsibius exemplaris]|uniref:Tryptase beta-2 n=1 Tax=Hypsibius exemplaris TaxID=2072580 RepID=A0A1W0W9R6_HYPEX|nr:putative Tryptase beta-2 [Hypsibius exemplaris]